MEDFKVKVGGIYRLPDDTETIVTHKVVHGLRNRDDSVTPTWIFVTPFGSFHQNGQAVHPITSSGLRLLPFVGSPHFSYTADMFRNEFAALARRLNANEINLEGENSKDHIDPSLQVFQTSAGRRKVRDFEDGDLVVMPFRENDDPPLWQSQEEFIEELYVMAQLKREVSSDPTRTAADNEARSRIIEAIKDIFAKRVQDNAAKLPGLEPMWTPDPNIVLIDTIDGVIEAQNVHALTRFTLPSSRVGVTITLPPSKTPVSLKVYLEQIYALEGMRYTPAAKSIFHPNDQDVEDMIGCLENTAMDLGFDTGSTVWKNTMDVLREGKSSKPPKVSESAAQLERLNQSGKMYPLEFIARAIQGVLDDPHLSEDVTAGSITQYLIQKFDVTL